MDRSPTFRQSPWWWIVVLYAPVIAFYASHFAAALTHPGLSPTGFIQYDQPSYMACAREFSDRGLGGLLFPFPSSPEADSQPIILQFHIWVLGQVWKVTHLDPGFLFDLFGALFGLLAIRVFLRVFDLLVPLKGALRGCGHVLFVWGGGLLALAGEVLNLLHGRPASDTWKHLLDVDPAHGWWMLNLGRCLILPCEAYYHFMFFSALLAVARHRFVLAAALLVLLVASHPIAGMGGLLVFFSWACMERWIVRDLSVRAWFPITLGVAAGGCFWLYLIWLPPRMDADLVHDLSLELVLPAGSAIAAYAIVGAMGLMRLRSAARLHEFASLPVQRFLLTWVLVQCALENHELFFHAHQPLHFTRGYSYAALFLIGAPWLFNEAWPMIKARWASLARPIAVAVMGLFLLDNIAFFSLNMKRQLRASSPGYWLTADQRGVLSGLNRLYDGRTLLMAQDVDLGYMAIVYTPFRAYRSHFLSGDDTWSRVEQHDAYFQGRIEDPLLMGPLVVVADKDRGDFVPPGHAELVYENKSYRVFRVD